MVQAFQRRKSAELAVVSLQKMMRGKVARNAVSRKVAAKNAAKTQVRAYKRRYCAIGESGDLVGDAAFCTVTWHSARRGGVFREPCFLTKLHATRK